MISRIERSHKMAADGCSLTETSWGTLTPIKRKVGGGREDGDPTVLSKSMVTIGRLQDCDMAHPSNMLLSGHHCKIFFSANSSKVFLCDTSKNGTLLNSEHVKNKTVEISGDAVIKCVYKKNDPSLDVTYHFKPASYLDKTCMNSTQEYSIESHGSQETADENVRKRRANSTDDIDSSPKMARYDSTCRPKSTEDEKRNSPDNDEELEENLTCGICQDIFYECVSVQPCMHSFCAACYSKWMLMSSKCPSCRKVINQVGKNHIVNNLAAAFLKKHPDRQRSKEELKEMDEHDKIKNETVKLGNRNRNLPREDDDYDDDDDDNDDDADDDDRDYALTSLSSNTDESTSSSSSSSTDVQLSSLLPRVPSVFSRAPTARCRQCPSFSYERRISNSSSADRSTPGRFTCSLNQVHIYCSCCQQCFPDRRNTILSFPQANTSAAASKDSNMDIQCTSCGRLYCHLYWGCRKPGCLGCLNRFKDFNFGEACLTRILNNNELESHVFKQYLARKNIGITELLRLCIEKLKDNEFVLSSRPNLRENDVVCFSCGLRYFKELAYQFRTEIPREELPNDIISREDCYWGMNCRTQQHNSSHARRYNHICKQTRFV